MVAAKVVPPPHHCIYLFPFFLLLSLSFLSLSSASFFSFSLSALEALQTKVAKPKKNYCSASLMLYNSVRMKELTTHRHDTVLMLKLFLYKKNSEKEYLRLAL